MPHFHPVCPGELSSPVCRVQISRLECGPALDLVIPVETCFLPPGLTILVSQKAFSFCCICCRFWDRSHEKTLGAVSGLQAAPMAACAAGLFLRSSAWPV